MESRSQTMLAGGVLLRLPRDEAKTLFVLRGESALIGFIWQLVEKSLASGDGSTLPLAGQAGELQARLAELDPDEATPLSQLFTGGRVMVDRQDCRIAVLRPDLVRLCAHRLTQVLARSAPAPGAVGAGNAERPVSPEPAEIEQFYAEAARIQAAIIFAIVADANEQNGRLN